MSVFVFEGGSAEEINIKVTANTAKVIVDATVEGPKRVSWFDVSENNGSTPTVTVEIWDGTTSFYLGSGSFTWVAKAVTAKQSVRFDQGYVIPLGSQLRVTSNDASGRLDVTGIVLSQNPTVSAQ